MAGRGKCREPPRWNVVLLLCVDQYLLEIAQILGEVCSQVLIENNQRLGLTLQRKCI